MLTSLTSAIEAGVVRGHAGGRLSQKTALVDTTAAAATVAETVSDAYGRRVVRTRRPRVNDVTHQRRPCTGVNDLAQTGLAAPGSSTPRRHRPDRTIVLPSVNVVKPRLRVCIALPRGLDAVYIRGGLPHPPISRCANSFVMLRRLLPLWTVSRKI